MLRYRFGIVTVSLQIALKGYKTVTTIDIGLTIVLKYARNQRVNGWFI